MILHNIHVGGTCISPLLLKWCDLRQTWWYLHQMKEAQKFSTAARVVLTITKCYRADVFERLWKCSATFYSSSNFFFLQNENVQTNGKPSDVFCRIYSRDREKKNCTIFWHNGWSTSDPCLGDVWLSLAALTLFSDLHTRVIRSEGEMALCRRRREKKRKRERYIWWKRDRRRERERKSGQ